MTKVVTYQLAYLSDRTVDLCPDCAVDPRVIDRVGVLGPCSHGLHRGQCEGCGVDRSEELYELVASRLGEASFRRAGDADGIGIIVRQALAEDPDVTVDEVVAIVRDAEAYAAAERERGY